MLILARTVLEVVADADTRALAKVWVALHQLIQEWLINREAIPWRLVVGLDRRDVVFLKPLISHRLDHHVRIRLTRRTIDEVHDDVVSRTRSSHCG